MSLPIQTTREDIDGIISYLKTKVTGATIDEAKSAIDNKLVDPRKITAYKEWKFINKEEGKLNLSQRGREYARSSKEKQIEIFKQIIREIKPYNIAAEWIFHQKFDQVTNVEVAAHWHTYCKEELGSDNETTISKQVVCFFNIAEAAGLGKLTIGRRGQSTRFDVYKDELSNFISEAGLTKKSDENIDESELETDVIADDEVTEDKEDDEIIEEEKSTEIRKEIETVKVFITHGKNMEIVDQVKTMLELAKLDYEVAVDEESPAIPIPEKVFSAMRECNAAVICVTADENMKVEDDKYHINQNVLIEIGAAFVLYDKRVVLVWDKRIEVPSNLQGLYRCEFEGDELSWSSGMKLMKAVNKFQSTK